MEILKTNEDTDILVRGLEIGFLVEKSRQQGFLDVRNSKELENLKLSGDDLDSLFTELQKQEVIIVY